MIVLDASAAVELLLATPAGMRVADRISPDEETLHAPHLIDLEVVQVLRRWCSSSVIDEADAQRALDDLARLGVVRYPHDVLVDRIWELRGNVTAYDAAYLSLAEALDAPLLTCDAKLGRVPGSVAFVEVV